MPCSQNQFGQQRKGTLFIYVLYIFIGPFLCKFHSLGCLYSIYIVLRVSKVTILTIYILTIFIVIVTIYYIVTIYSIQLNLRSLERGGKT